MRRAFAFIGLFVRIAVVAAAALWLAMYPGTINIEWQGYTITTSVGFAAFVIAVLFFIFAVLYHNWRLLLAWPRLWRKQRQIKALELGYKALNKGLLAVAAGDNTTATKQTKRAIKFLPEMALTHLLAAQTAQLNHDDVAADTHLAKLMLHPDGQLFALRGQLTRALARDDRTEALRLSRLSYQQQPTQPWIIDTAVQMEARQQNWLQAEKILRAAVRLNDANEPRWQKDLAAVLVCLSDAARTRGSLDEALECAREAVKRNPSWSPAIIRVATLWQQKTYRRRAQKALINGWENAPHPDLVTAWIHIMGSEHAQDTTAIVEKLVSHNPDTAEAAMAMAMAAIKMRLWGVARQHALRALDKKADRQTYRLLAEIERQDTNDQTKIAAWLDKAATAPLEVQWACSVTHDVFSQWQALNRQHHFNTIQWQVPMIPGTPVIEPTAAPLLVITP